MESPAAATPLERRWRRTTLLTLLVGYGGYYVCRADFSVIKPLLLDRYGALGLTKVHLGWVGTAGTLCYALGKLANGVCADRYGGRRLFLLGIVVSVACTLLLAASAPLLGAGLSAWLLLVGLSWSVNRWFQSMGWVGLINVACRWYPFESQARVMGLLSLSYLFGDAAAQAWLGAFIKLGAGWPVVLLVAALTFGAIGLVARALLHGSPAELGLPEPLGAAETVFGSLEPTASPSVRQLLAPLLTSPAFWVCGGLNFGLTLIRETFREWQPTFLHEVTGLDAGWSAVAGMLFPLTGGLAALVAGWAADRCGGRRERVMLPALAALVLALAALALRSFDGRPVAALLVTSVVSFCLLAPYTLLSGVLAMDLGGKVGSATAAGLIDGLGYLGGMAAGVGVGSLAERHGWSAAFGALGVVAAVTLAAATAHAVGVSAGRVAARCHKANGSLSSG